MSIFIIVITTVIGTFGNVVNVRRKAKSVQQNLENMKYVMELMAKNVRMSSKTTDGGSNQTIYMYNNSEEKCISYMFTGSSLEKAENGDNKNDCGLGSTFSSYISIASGSITGKFSVVSSDDSPKNVGKVTISMEISTGSGSSTDIVRSQTTVSLRGYDEVGI